jgi:hypothetical protein
MDDFFKKLIEDKAEHLAFYFLINDFVYYDKLDTELLFEYFEQINTAYTDCFNELLKTYLNLQNSKNINNFAELIIKFNNKNNIFKNNYGTEGHILDFFLDFNGNQDDYIEQLTNYINKFNQEKFEEQVYTFVQFLNKIGCDLAIYQFIYTNNELIMDFSNYKKMFQDCFRKAYEKFTNPTFFNKIEQIYKNEMENKSVTSKRLIKKKDKDKIKLLQQYFNIYKYPTKTRKDGGKIVYYNTIKLTFKTEKKFYKNTKDSKSNKIGYKQFLFKEFEISPIKPKIKTFDKYYHEFMKLSFHKLNELENSSSSSKIKFYVLNLVKAIKILEKIKDIKHNTPIIIDDKQYSLESILELLQLIYQNLTEEIEIITEIEVRNIIIKIKNKIEQLKETDKKKLSIIHEDYDETDENEDNDELIHNIGRLEIELSYLFTDNIKETDIKKLINIFILIKDLLLAYLKKANIDMNDLISELTKINENPSIIDKNTKSISNFKRINELLALNLYFFIKIYESYRKNQSQSINTKLLKNKLSKRLSAIRALKNSSLQQRKSIIRNIQRRLKSDNKTNNKELLSLTNDGIKKKETLIGIMKNTLNYFRDIKLSFYSMLSTQSIINKYFKDMLQNKKNPNMVQIFLEQAKILADIKKKQEERSLDINYIKRLQQTGILRIN